MGRELCNTERRVGGGVKGMQYTGRERCVIYSEQEIGGEGCM